MSLLPYVLTLAAALRARVKINSLFGRRSLSPGCVAYRDVGKGREHAYRDDAHGCASVMRGQEPEVTVGGRATQDAVAEDAEALPTGT